MTKFQPPLNQLILGNSYKEFCIPDFVSSLLYELSESLALKNPNNQVHGVLGGDYGYGQDFKNEIFEMFPYYWGDCDCGYEDKEMEWADNNKHSENCYQTEYSRLRLHTLNWNEKQQPTKDLCKKYNLSYPDGSITHCTCDYEIKWNKFLSENTHSNDCSYTRSNFKHYKTGTEISWYKYIGRGESCNKSLTRKEWIKIFEECFNSL